MFEAQQINKRETISWQYYKSAEELDLVLPKNIYTATRNHHVVVLPPSYRLGPNRCNSDCLKSWYSAFDSVNLSFVSICMFSLKKRIEREDINLETDYSAIG